MLPVDLWARPQAACQPRTWPLAGWLLVGGGWLAVATAAGPSHPPLGALWLWGTVACDVPWWANHWRRARVRVARTVDRWPELTHTVVRLAGSTIASAWSTCGDGKRGWCCAGADGAGGARPDRLDRVRVGTRPGAVGIEPDHTDARALLLRVIESDPHAKPIPWPGLAGKDRADTITRPAVVGL